MTGKVTIVFTGSGTAGRSGQEPGTYFIYLVEEWKVAGDRINDTPTQNYLNRQSSTTNEQNRSPRGSNESF